MSDPVSNLKQQLLAAAERQQEQTIVARKSPRRWLERSGVRRGGRRRRRLVAVAATAVVAVGAASAFGTAHEFLFVQAKPFAQGKLTRTVDGVRFSLNVPRTGWENGPHERLDSGKDRTHSLLISKSTVGPQGAEAIIFWAGLQGGGEAKPCAKVLPSAAGRSRAELAAAVASAPGTKVAAGGFSRVTVGGRPATRVVLWVRRNLGCDPGFFFTWPNDMPRFNGGAFWPGTQAGDKIRVWIVDVGGKRLVFEAVTKPGNGIEQEIGDIIRSIRFY